MYREMLGELRGICKASEDTARGGGGLDEWRALQWNVRRIGIYRKRDDIISIFDLEGGRLSLAPRQNVSAIRQEFL